MPTQIGIGTPSQSPWPSVWNPGRSTTIGVECEYRNAAPPKMERDPSVAMNGLTRSA
jgi:hypothetical protein